MQVRIMKAESGQQTVLIVPNVSTRLAPIQLSGTMKGTLKAAVAEAIAAVDALERPAVGPRE